MLGIAGRCGRRSHRRLVSGQPAPAANGQGWSLEAAIFAPRVPCKRDPGFFYARAPALSTTRDVQLGLLARMTVSPITRDKQV